MEGKAILSRGKLQHVQLHTERQSVPTRSLEWPRLFDHCSNCTQWQCEETSSHLQYSCADAVQCMKRAASGGGRVREVLCSKRDSDYIGVQAISNRYLLRSYFVCTLSKKQDCNDQKFYISNLCIWESINRQS